MERDERQEIWVRAEVLERLDERELQERLDSVAREARDELLAERETELELESWSDLEAIAALG